MRLPRILFTMVALFVVTTLSPIIGSLALVGLGTYAVVKKTVAAKKENSGDSVVSGRKDADRSQKTKSDSVQKEYDRKKGWVMSEIPVGMRTDGHADRNGITYFDCNGISRAVSAKAEGKNAVVYSTQPMSEADAKKCADLKNRHRDLHDLKIVSVGNGSYMASTSSIVGMKALMDNLYPMRVENVSAETEMAKYYVIRGASSYEDARRMFETAKESNSLESAAYIGVSHRFSVDGKKVGEMLADEWKPKSLEVGSYVIKETYTDKFESEMKIPGNVRTRSELSGYVASGFDYSEAVKTVDGHRDGAEIENATGHVARHIVDVNGDVCPLGRSASAEDPALVMRFSSHDEAFDFLNRGEVPEGMLASLERKPDEARDGEYVISIPVREGEIEGLKMYGADYEALKKKYPALSDEEVRESLLRHRLDRDGCATVVIDKSRDFDGATINGVGIDELSDRLSNDRLSKMKGGEDLQTWMKDAVQIYAVSVTVDLKKAQLRIESNVNNDIKVETKNLSQDDVKALSQRGEITKAEAKDLLMQIHPSQFKSYRAADGGGLFVDPVESFIKGEKPVLKSVAFGETLQREKTKEKSNGMKF